MAFVGRRRLRKGAYRPFLLRSVEKANQETAQQFVVLYYQYRVSKYK